MLNIKKIMGVCGKDTDNKNNQIISNINYIKKIINSAFSDCECDTTKGLQLSGLEQFINSIFTNDFPLKEIEEIRAHLLILNNKDNKNLHLFILKNISKYQYYYFILLAKKINEDTLDIFYKFKIEKIELAFDFDIVDTTQSSGSKIDIQKISQEKKNEINKLVKEDINNFKETTFK